MSFKPSSKSGRKGPTPGRTTGRSHCSFTFLAFDSWFVVVIVNNSGPHGLAIFQLIFVNILNDLGYNMIHIDLNYLNTGVVSRATRNIVQN